ncbi:MULTISPECIES: FcoT family thioesterase [Actinosynnema]|uniref:FcoT family thioesterase n=1 Tax=Actinosynnema TaxID=40566 RepID=UPI0020A3A071|nr:FcoT family thioesterase [Actinosynnema pretiosum]MCP2098871.1 FcoT-like thioesterase domain-containing protein [Actinosynnema pretiosum]
MSAPSAAAPSGPAPTGPAATAELLERALSCYKPHCRYLKAVELGGHRATGEFAIPESCYIDDTGHLNAVEVNICYNQLLYTLLASLVRDGSEPALAGWDMAEFWRRRLPDVLIAGISSNFRKPIDPRAFTGELSVRQARTRTLRHGEPPLVDLDTAFAFRDSGGGLASGTARIVITGGGNG